MSSGVLAAAPSERPFPRLGPYEPFRRLAAGGMGELFLAHLRGPSGFAKLVVVKRILPALAVDPGFVAMFLNEARLAATLSHPNIVQVFDAGRTDDSYYYAMEYLHGADLGELMRAAAARGAAVPHAHALAIAIAAAAGLHHAHEARGQNGALLEIVHRDVSPSNVMLTFEGDIKLLDFGIAKALSATTVTRKGTRKGKVAYMSPEQCLCAHVDRRSDIYSLGILLYEATVMRRLFRGDNEFAIMNMITAGRVPRPSSVRPNYPAELERIVLKALACDPDDRYPTARDLQHDLEQFADEHGLRPSPTAAGRYLREVLGERPVPVPEADEQPTLPRRSFADLSPVTAVEDVLRTRAGNAPIEPRPTRGASLRALLVAGLGFSAIGFAVALALVDRDAPVEQARVEPSSARLPSGPAAPAPANPAPTPADPPAQADPSATDAGPPPAAADPPAEQPALTDVATPPETTPIVELAGQPAEHPTVAGAAPPEAAPNLAEPPLAGRDAARRPARRSFKSLMDRARSDIRKCLRKQGLLDGDSVQFDIRIDGKTGRISNATPLGPHQKRKVLGECIVSATARSTVQPPPPHEEPHLHEVSL